MNSKIKVIWLSPRFMYPLNAGGKIRSYNLLKHLSSEHNFDVTLVSFFKKDDMQHIPNLKSIVNRLECISFSESEKGSLKFFIELFCNLFSFLPYVISKYKSRSMKKIITNLLCTDSFDIIICDFLTSSVNTPLKLTIPKILFEHNVETVIWERLYKIQKNIFKKAMLYLQFLKMQRYEQKMVHAFDRCFAVSENDKKYFESAYNVKNIAVLKTGVDTAYFRPYTEQPSEEALIFVGSMNWLANIDAVCYFIAEVFPTLKKSYPNLKIYLVGQSPADIIYKFSHEDINIVVTGTVPDVRDYMARSSVFIVPLRVGGGTRIKIYEAMAMGMPIVSTSIGAEGLLFKHNENIIIADDAQHFASAILRLLADQTLRKQIGANARKFVEENCDWSNIAKTFSTHCLEVIAAQKRKERVSKDED